MLGDDEYGPPDENAARELGEVYRLVYGMSPAGSVESQEGRCQCVQEKGQGREQDASGPAAKRGPRRVLDADAASDRRIVVDVTDEFHRHVKHAAFLDRISMTEPVLCVLSPEVDRILGDADVKGGAMKDHRGVAAEG